MELLHFIPPRRLAITNSSSKSRNFAAPELLVGLEVLLTLDSTTSDEQPRIAFNVPNLSTTLIEVVEEDTMSPNPSTSQQKPPQLNPQPYIFFSHYIPKIFSPRPNHCSPIFVPKPFDSIVLTQLPRTKCLNHGNHGFLHYDYVERLPEYTCTTPRHPMFSVQHIFEVCILEFPEAPYPVHRSQQELRKANLMRTYCYEYYLKFSDINYLGMFRYGNQHKVHVPAHNVISLCKCPKIPLSFSFLGSQACQEEAVLIRYWYKNMIEALNAYLLPAREEDEEEEDTIFEIEL